ncbi:MAG TPA: amino acid ABC transporter permease [Bauldia sp.]|nr:amino acid ABC transporter permease [Bauldia sp.]
MAAPDRPRREFPFWLLAAVLIAAVFAWMIAADGDYRVIFRALLRGVATSLWISFVAFFFACLLGLLVAIARRSALRVVREIATFYVEIVRGVPALVLLFYVAFVGAPALVAAWNWVAAWTGGVIPQGTVRDFSLVWRAIFALTISYSAFLSEIFRAGIESVARPQVEGAYALGLSRYATLRNVILPQAIRVVLPPLGNDFVAMIKDSALVSSLGVQDITQLGKIYSSSTFLFFETYNVVAYLYLVMTVTLSLLVRWLEARLKRQGWTGT